MFIGHVVLKYPPFLSYSSKIRRKGNRRPAHHQQRQFIIRLQSLHFWSSVLHCSYQAESLGILQVMGSQSNTHCPICFNIYIEPIDLPCDHCLCKPCFEELIKKSNMQCPFCRRRIGSWTRLHTRKGSLVNVDKWNYIQTTYPEEVNARLAGKETPRKIGNSDSPTFLPATYSN